MNSIFKDYTETRKPIIESIVKRVNDMSLKYKNITTDKSRVSFEIDGVLIQCTKEEEYFIKKTNEFRRRLREGQTIDEIMVEALALVREAIDRRLHMRPYDTQIEAAVSMIGDRIDALHRERVIAEMKTGEGKTLVQILVAYLNVLEATKDEDRSKWSSVHVITSNDALAKRDQHANNAVFSLLGISSGFVPGRSATRTTDPAKRMINKKNKQNAYRCDVVYATATTIAFDYLEDNTIYDLKDRNINRSLGFAIVDEADDILIDQAINPLKLSVRPNPNGNEYDKLLIERESERRQLYKWATDFLYGLNRKKPMKGTIFNQYIPSKDEINDYNFDDYAFTRDTKEVFLSKRIQKEIGLDLSDDVKGNMIYNARYFALIDCIKAKEAFKSDVEYRVDVSDGKGKVVLIDANLGRKKYSSKYVGGMQEAIEAKEEYLEWESENAKKRYHIEFSSNLITRATCTYPDFMSIYKHNVCGMTGTSDEEEFNSLYGFETYRVRTRKRNIRIDEESELYATTNEKYNAIIEEVKKCTYTGQPVLIGTTSLKESEIISSLLNKNHIRHQLLNANNEEEENQIVAGAGMMGTVTVATNMAGRGTDIKLGPQVKERGGLYVIGTSRNKSQRIDRQLMGRSGRQGDPGKTKYFSSLEDDLAKEYYRGSLDGIIKIYAGSNKPIKNKRIIEAASRAQLHKESKDKAVRIDSEKFNVSFMKHRREIYENRNKVLECNLLEFINMIKSILVKYVDFLLKNNTEEEIINLIGHLVPVKSLFTKNVEETKENLINALYAKFRNNFSSAHITNEEVYAYVVNMKRKFLSIIDTYWLSHIEYLEDLKYSITLNPSRDPFMEFEIASTKSFAEGLIPSMYNEMITYAINPSMKYGTYIIKNNDNVEEEKYVL